MLLSMQPVTVVFNLFLSRNSLDPPEARGEKKLLNKGKVSFLEQELLKGKLD